MNNLWCLYINTRSIHVCRFVILQPMIVTVLSCKFRTAATEYGSLARPSATRRVQSSKAASCFSRTNGNQTVARVVRKLFPAFPLYYHCCIGIYNLLRNISTSFVEYRNIDLVYSYYIIMSSSFISQVMQPGGGVMLLPLVRGVIGVLLVLTLAGFLSGVARIHMAVLSFLGAGLLFSLSMFESEFKRLQSRQSSSSSSSSSSTTTTTTTTTSGKNAKTD